MAIASDTHNEKLLAEIAKFQAVRQNRIREMVAKLNRLHVPLKVEAVFALANCKSPGRPHVARALTKAGLVRNLDEAFERFLKKNRPAWVPKAKMSALEGIELIHQAGGLAVMAHPGLNRTDDDHSRARGRRVGRHRMLSHETLDHDVQTLSGNRRQISPARDAAARIATVSARANRLSAPSNCPTNSVEKLKSRAESRKSGAANPQSAIRNPQ